MPVSIVIPAYNAAHTISDTLNSVRAQTYADWEGIVVDDGSTDSTAEIATAFARQDGRFRVIKQPNGGESAARNSGTAAARHDWLLFLDADDWISPLHLERMTDKLGTKPELDAVHCLYARVAADGTHVVDSYQPPCGDMFPILARRAAFPVHACSVRKSLVEEVGGFDVSLRTSPDWDLWQRISRTGARFGAVREVLAFYRMSPTGASLEGCQLFQDGMRVLKQGHSFDPRVPNPHPDHERGEPPEQIKSQQFYLLSWCAGLLIGRHKDTAPLLTMVGNDEFPELYPDAVAQCIFDAVPLPACQPPREWEKLWPGVERAVEDFFIALERQAAARGLANGAMSALKRMILKSSPTWSVVVDAMTAPLEQEIRKWRSVAEQQEARAGVLEQERAAMGQAQARLERERDELRERVKSRTAELDELRYSDERRIGELLLNRLRLGALFKIAELVWARGQRGLCLARLRVESRFLAGRRNRHRALAVICDIFPIYSQTFVYQELTQLVKRGFDIRIVYSKLDRRDCLAAPFAPLWDVKRRLILNRRVHEQDFAFYHSRMGSAVDTLVDRLCRASGLSRQALLNHDNFLQAFSFTRMAEAYRPQYLHSYFFYDRSLMALVAAYLLNLPRGISCYADHLLKDYELKVVPLHMELCDVIIATSQRIKTELLGIAPSADAERILVKPNGIDTECFPVAARVEPPAGAPFRIVAVCRIEPKKGLMELVDAVNLLRQRGLLVEAHVVGGADEWSEASRDYKRKLDERISELGMWGTVHLEGRQNLAGILGFLRMAHLFVAPFVETESGDKDGIPTALLEGMSTGLPVVATNAGSITEVIDNGKEGLIVAQRDADALASAIGELIRDHARRLSLGSSAARKVRDKFDVAKGEHIFHDRLAELLSSRSQLSGRARRDREADRVFSHYGN